MAFKPEKNSKCSSNFAADCIYQIKVLSFENEYIYIWENINILTSNRSQDEIVTGYLTFCQIDIYCIIHKKYRDFIFIERIKRKF